MAETLTPIRSRIMYGNMLGYIFENSTTKSGLPRTDPSKITITASGGAVTVGTVSALLSLAGDVWSPWWTYPQYSLRGVDTVLKGWLPLSRKIKQDETVTIDFAKGFVADATNDNAAVSDFVGEPLTFLDDDEEITPDSFRRVGCGLRPKTDPATLSPSLIIKASDFAADGDGNAITARSATVGGTVTPTGSILYHADGVASNLINGTTGAPVLEVPAGGILTTTVTLPSSTSDYTILVTQAFSGTSGNITVTGSSLRINVGGTASNATRGIQNVQAAGTGFTMGGTYENTASAGFRRLQTVGGSYQHAAPIAIAYGYGGSRTRTISTSNTTYDHSVAITITANSVTAYISQITVIPSADTTGEVARAMGAWLDDEYNTTNRVFFVDPVGGNDTNSGLVSSSPRLTLPNMNSSSTDYACYGAGDVIAVKKGTVTADVSIFNRPLFAAAYGYSSQFPGVIMSYGDRADGYWELQGQSAGTSVTIHQQNPHFVVAGLRLNQECRNPLNDTHYDGFTTAKAIAGGQFQGDMATSPIATHLGDADLDPPMQQFIDCDTTYAKGKCFLDSNGTYSGENWFAVVDCVMDRNWDDTLSGALAAAGPSATFWASTCMGLFAGNVAKQVGAMWDEPASIGDHSAGAQVYTNEASATFLTGKTTVTLTGIATNYVPGGAIARGIVRCKRTSDATVIRAEIESKTNNNTFVINGNPFNLADGVTISDALFHGGLPAAPDARNHLIYTATGSPGGQLSINNMANGIASDGFQHRSGGWVVDNVIRDAAILGFSADLGTSVIDGNYAEAGHRNYSNFGSGRVWGWNLLNTIDYGIMQNNIVNLSPTGFGSDVVGGQSGGSFSLQMEQQGTAANRPYIVRNNTVTSTVGVGLTAISNTDLSTKEISRNIIQPNASGLDLVNAKAQVNATFDRNAWYSPDGAGADRFTGLTENFSEFQTSASATNDIFSETTFATPVSLSVIADYYATLPGGSSDPDAWIDAVLAAKRVGNLGALNPIATMDYIRERFRPTNRTLVEGDGVLMGAVALAAAPTIDSITAVPVPVIGSTTAQLSANVTDDGGAAITARGIVYSVTATNAAPTIGGTGATAVAAGTASTGVFTVTLTGLTPSTAYSYQGYATNSSGTSYTGVSTFTTNAGTPAVAGRARDRSRIR